MACWHHIAIKIGVNIAVGNGLLPVGTKTLPNQYWRNICDVPWNSPENNVTAIAEVIILFDALQNQTYEIISKFARKRGVHA